jgi:hypothetical protein
MTNLNIFNIFKRISALEAARARADITIDNMKGLLRDQSQWLVALQTAVTKPKAKPAAKAKAKAGPKPKNTLDKAAEKKREYARAYYAKKRAAKAAA